MTWNERYKDDGENFIAVIRWSADDVREELTHCLKREPTDDELFDVLDNFDAETLKDRSIELGWEIVSQLTADAAQAAGVEA